MGSSFWQGRHKESVRFALCRHKTQIGGNNADIKRELSVMSLSNKFMWSPSEYAECAVIAQEAGAEMLERLDWVTLQPKMILDVGCGAGAMSTQLQKRYPDARVVGVDASAEMCAAALQQGIECLQADAADIPLPSATVDMIFANLLTPWCADLPALFKEWRRLLRPDGLLIFTGLGPDTLSEYQPVFGLQNMPQLVDMHEVGDLLLAAGFADPVMDINYLTTVYKEKNRFLHELVSTGMLVQGLDISVEPNSEGVCEAVYEIYFAHAFMPAQGDEYAADSDGVARIPLSALRRQAK